MAPCLKIAHTGAVDVSFLKTLTTLPFSLHVGNLFASLARNSSNLCSLSAFFFNWRSNLLSCEAIEAFFPLGVADKPYVEDLNFFISCVEAWLFSISFTVKVYQLA